MDHAEFSISTQAIPVRYPASGTDGACSPGAVRRVVDHFPSQGVAKPGALAFGLLAGTPSGRSTGAGRSRSPFDHVVGLIEDHDDDRVIGGVTARRGAWSGARAGAPSRAGGCAPGAARSVIAPGDGERGSWRGDPENAW